MILICAIKLRMSPTEQFIDQCCHLGVEMLRRKTDCIRIAGNNQQSRDSSLEETIVKLAGWLIWIHQLSNPLNLSQDEATR